jgi:hypothetical protein
MRPWSSPRVKTEPVHDTSGYPPVDPRSGPWGTPDGHQGVTRPATARRRLLLVCCLIAGTGLLLVVAGSFLPWVVSGTVSRSSYAIVGISARPRRRRSAGAAGRRMAVRRGTVCRAGDRRHPAVVADGRRAVRALRTGDRPAVLRAAGIRGRPCGPGNPARTHRTRRHGRRRGAARVQRYRPGARGRFTRSPQKYSTPSHPGLMMGGGLDH